MNYFNGRFDITDGGYHDETHYKIIGNIVDNSGTYFSSDANVGDIIYADGTPLGVPLLRYKITEILPESSGATLSVLVEWDMIEGIDAQEPYSGMEAIIGALHDNGLTANITSQIYNSVNEILTTNTNSYQTMLLGNISGGGVSPDLSQVNKRINELEKRVDSVTLEWEEMFVLSN